jgi:hypothetical protein
MKHKIVKFTNGLARVLITDDMTPYLPLEDNKNLFINPDLKYVRGVSPELWTVKDGIIWPMEGEALETRLSIVKVQPEAVVPPTKHLTDLLLKLDVYKSESVQENSNLLLKLDDYRNESVKELKIALELNRSDNKEALNQLNMKWRFAATVSIVTLLVINLVLKFLV